MNARTRLLFFIGLGSCTALLALFIFVPGEPTWKHVALQACLMLGAALSAWWERDR